MSSQAVRFHYNCSKTNVLAGIIYRKYSSVTGMDFAYEYVEKNHEKPCFDNTPLFLGFVSGARSRRKRSNLEYSGKDNHSSERTWQ